MCRHLAWLGEPRSVSDLVLDRPHGLLTQSFAPRRQSHGLMNADGWGVGLHVADHRAHPEPVRWRSSRPLWSDPSFASVAPLLSAGAVLAAVRSATVGMPADETAAAPFTDGRWLVSHNGTVDRAALPDAARAAAESVCDSAILTAHVLERGVDRLVETVTAVAAADPGARLSLLLVAPDRVLGLTWGDPLSVLVEPDGVAVASEPWDDDPRWTDVPDRHLVELSRPAGSAAVPTVAVTDLTNLTGLTDLTDHARLSQGAR